MVKLVENDKRVCYTYLIGWSKFDMWYYGRSTRKNCNPDKFWKKYFTSSNAVKEFRIEHGEPDIIQIRNTFGIDYKQCNKWEHRFLTRIDAKNNPFFLNKSNGSWNFDTTNTNFGRKGIVQDWFVGYDSEGKCLGKILKNDPRRGVTIFGVGKNSIRYQDWCVAYSVNGIYIGKRMTSDSLWGIEYFGFNKNKPNKSKGKPQDWAIAFDKDKNYIGKVLSSDPGWGTIYFGQNTGGNRSDKGSSKDSANAYDVAGAYVGYMLKSDPLWGIEYFGNRAGKINPNKGKVSEYFNAYDKSGNSVGMRLKNDPERNKSIFGANTKHLESMV